MYFFIDISPREEWRTNLFFHHADLSHVILLGHPGVKERLCLSKYMGQLAVFIYWFSRLLSPLAKKEKMLMLLCFKRLSASVCPSNWRIKMLLYSEPEFKLKIRTISMKEGLALSNDQSVLFFQCRVYTWFIWNSNKPKQKEFLSSCETTAVWRTLTGELVLVIIPPALFILLWFFPSVSFHSAYQKFSPLVPHASAFVYLTCCCRTCED